MCKVSVTRHVCNTKKYYKITIFLLSNKMEIKEFTVYKIIIFIVDYIATRANVITFNQIIQNNFN